MYIAYKEILEKNVSLFLSYFFPFQVTKKTPKSTLPTVLQESLGKETANDISSHEPQT